MKNFIEIYENAIPKEICKYFIDFFNIQHELNETYQGGIGHGKIDIKRKNSTDLNLLHNKFTKDKQHSDVVEAYVSLTYNKFLDYLKIYTLDYYQKNIDENQPLFKKPKTALMHMYEPPDGGFHKWHQDWSSSPYYSSRILVGMTYLNDVEEGGETEFYNQKVKIKPKQGTLVVFPTYFTHLHRGNKPISNRKYIINLWGNIAF